MSNETETKETITVDTKEIGDGIILPDFKPLPDITNISMNYVSAFNTGMNIYQCLNYLQGYTEITYDGLVQLIKDLKEYKKALEAYIDAMKQEIEEKLAEQQEEIDANKADIQTLKDTKVDRAGDEMTGGLVLPGLKNNTELGSSDELMDNFITLRGYGDNRAVDHYHHMYKEDEQLYYTIDFGTGKYYASNALLLKASEHSSPSSVYSDVEIGESSVTMEHYENSKLAEVNVNATPRVLIKAGYTYGYSSIDLTRGALTISVPQQTRPLFNSKPMALLEDISGSGGGITKTTVWEGEKACNLLTATTLGSSSFTTDLLNNTDILLFTFIIDNTTLVTKYATIPVWVNKNITQEVFCGRIDDGPVSIGGSEANYTGFETILKATITNGDLSVYLGKRSYNETVDSTSLEITKKLNYIIGHALTKIESINLTGGSATADATAEAVLNDYNDYMQQLSDEAQKEATLETTTETTTEQTTEPEVEETTEETTTTTGETTPDNSAGQTTETETETTEKPIDYGQDGPSI